MTCFHDFNAPLWGIFGGNSLLFAASVFYILWWVSSYRVNAAGGTSGAGFFIIAALFTGMAAIAVMAGGINSMAQGGKGVPVWIILLGFTVLFIVLLVVTQSVFKRMVTSELLIMCLWAALETSAIAVLQGSGRFGTGKAVTLAIFIGAATVIGLVCYVLHYRLDETLRFWNGLMPLTVDAVWMAAFLGFLAVS